MCIYSNIGIKKIIYILFFKHFFHIIANMDIKFFTKTKLYAKHGHTFYNVTSCKGENSWKSMRIY